MLIEEIRVVDFKKLLDKLSQNVASRLLHKYLQLLFMKYPYNYELLHKYSELLEENRYDSLKRVLPDIEYEKVFKLYLLNNLGTEDSVIAFRTEMKKVLARNIAKVTRFLQENIKEQLRSDNSLFEDIIKYPNKLKGHNKTVYGLLRLGHLTKAEQFTKLI